MNFLVLPCVLLLAVWVGAQGQDEAGSFYDSRYDYLDIDAILSSKRLVRNYVDCLLNKKPCSPEGKALRRILPEGLRTKCARCNSHQKHNALVILRGLRDNYPEEWSLLSAKWDPTGDFTKRFVNFLDKDDNNNVDTPIQPILPAAKPATNPPPRPAILSRFSPEEVGDQGSPSEVRPTIRAPPTVNVPPPVVNVPRPAVSGPPPVINGPPPVDNLPPQIFTRSPQATTRSPQMVNLTPIPTIRSPPVTARSTMITTPAAIPITMRLATQPAPRPTQAPQRVTQAPVRPRPRPTNAPQFVVMADTRPVMGLIDHFGNKIIRTTELFTGLLKNTVRIVVG